MNTTIYNIKIDVNGETHQKDTEDLFSTLKEFIPEYLFTEMYVEVTNGETVINRKLTLNEAKNMLRSDDVLQIFINNLIFA